MVNSKNRPAIPSEVALILRQQSGFGCCICGHPFIQYHHIIAWAEDNHFRPDDMMVLCGNCHPLATVGAISIEQQREAKLHPHNIRNGLALGELYVTSNDLVIRMGSCTAVNTPRLLSIRGKTILSARKSEDGRVLISAEIQNRTGNTIATLVDNQWSVQTADAWDFEVKPRHAAVRLAAGDVAYSIDTRRDEISMTGRWFTDQTSIDFTPTIIRVGGSTIRATSSVNCGGFIGVD